MRFEKWIARSVFRALRAWNGEYYEEIQRK